MELETRFPPDIAIIYRSIDERHHAIQRKSNKMIFRDFRIAISLASPSRIIDRPWFI